MRCLNPAYFRASMHQSQRKVSMVVRKLHTMSDGSRFSCWKWCKGSDIHDIYSKKCLPEGDTTGKLIECPKWKRLIFYRASATVMAICPLKLSCCTWKFWPKQIHPLGTMAKVKVHFINIVVEICCSAHTWVGDDPHTIAMLAQPCQWNKTCKDALDLDSIFPSCRLLNC